MKAPLPLDEEERLKALRRYEILDTDSEPEFDDITLLASHICGTPIAMISLVDENRQWFKSSIGVTATETSRDVAFCAHGILQQDVFIVEDALADERFASNPLVTGNPNIRFYAGSPLITHDGHALGMLCVNDRVPRELSADQKAALRALSRQVVAQLELRHTVSQLKRTEESLRVRDYAFATSVSALAMSDLVGNLTYVNGAYQRMFGFASADDMLGKPFAPSFADAATVAAAFQSVLEQGQWNGELKARREDGTLFDVLISASLVRDAKGRPLCSIASMFDITERKRSEMALRVSEEKFLQLANNITDVFWITAPDFNTIYYVSPGYERIWGRSMESLYARPHQWVEAILPEERERVFAIFSTLGVSVPEVSVEYRIARPDGTVRWVHDRGFEVRNAAGALIRLSGIASDITERKRTEDSLRESEEKFRQLAGNITDVFWMTSPDLQTIHYVSPAYKQIWGQSVESVYANPRQWADAIVPEDRERVFATFLKLTDELSVSAEFQIVRPDGATRWILSRGFQVRDSGGNVIRLTGIASDITERKRVEEHLFQSQKMETVGKLAGGIAHEFNSIMTAIIGQSELMLADLPTGNPLCKNAQEIRQAADRAATLTRQLLAYGRKQILQPKILDLNKLIADMEGMLRHLMRGDANVRIVPFVSLKPVKIDAGQIEQVIVNIAMNAADAMPNGGRLTLETANVTLDDEYVRHFPDLKAGEYVMLAITDTGVGMSEEVKARVFEPFFTTKDVGKGTGLGLATCHGIIKQSGGHIAVYSESGRGTTFKVYLPQVEQPTKVIAPRRESSDLPRGTEAILVVEDDPALREMSAALLRRLGYTVLAAANGVEALNLTHQQGTGHIDLLFTDVVMPQMSGKELSDRIHVSRPNTKILFASAYAENAIVHQGVLDEGVELLQKPFTPSALASKIREVLNSGNKN